MAEKRKLEAVVEPPLLHTPTPVPPAEGQTPLRSPEEDAEADPTDGARATTPPPPAQATLKRPPALTVDTSCFDAPEPVVPRTPANVRSLQRTEMHAMVCAGNVHGTQELLSAGHSLDAQEEHGFTPLHNAAALPNAEARAALVAMLLSHGADLWRKDREGYSPLHWAAACGHADVVRQLLSAGARVGDGSMSGETALHRAARFGRVECVTLLVQAGAQPAAHLNRQFESALDVAGKAEKRLNRALRQAARRAMLEASPPCRVLLLHHPECSQHATGDAHQEHPLRIDAVLGRVLPPVASPEPRGTHGGSAAGGASSSGDAVPSAARARTHAAVSSDVPRFELQEATDFPPASVDALRRVHDASFLASVASMSQAMSLNPPHSPVPFTPLVQRTNGVAFDALKDPKTCDTRISAGSYAAARRAAGSVIHAVDAVLAGRSRNALCVVRPPGHHAGVKGLIPGSCSCGFCLFNSVMVGAAHALFAPPPPSPPAAPTSAPTPSPAVDSMCLPCEEDQQPASAGPRGFDGRARRVAVIDIDVHHGDGSEEILRHLAPRLPPGALFFASIHLFDPGDATFGQFYPGSGAADAMQVNAINVPITPMWRRNKTEKAAHVHHSKGGGAGSGSPRSPAFGSGRSEWRAAFGQRVLPALRAFCPDLLLISAGFDGGAGDVGNSKLDVHEKYHQGLDLLPADFEWVTEQLLSVAAVCCPGRVVSVLEGGYGVYEFSKTSETGWVISRTQLGENVAAHLTALTGVNPRPVV